MLDESYAFYRQFYQQALGIDGCCPHDSCALVWLLRPDLFSVERGHLSVVTDGLAEGQTVMAPEQREFVDTRWSQGTAAEVCLSANGPGVIDWIVETLTTYPSP